jgi:GT2 family glycosyltransferase
LSDPEIWGSTGPAFAPGAPRSSRANFPYEPSYLHGCNMAIRRDAFEKIGLFNEILEIHLDDAEISCRIRWKGGHLLYTPQAQLIHHERVEGGTRNDPRRSPEYMRKHVRSEIFWAREVGTSLPWATWRLARRFIVCRRPLGIQPFIGFCRGVFEGHREYVQQGRPRPDNRQPHPLI